MYCCRPAGVGHTTGYLLGGPGETDHQFGLCQSDFPPGAGAVVGRQRHRASQQSGCGGQRAAVPSPHRGGIKVGRKSLVGVDSSSGAVPHLPVGITLVWPLAWLSQ